MVRFHNLQRLSPQPGDRSRSQYTMTLSRVQQAVLLAAYFRGGDPDEGVWSSSCDQVVMLSLFYSGDISASECMDRFSERPHLGGLYQNDGKLVRGIARRYRMLIKLLRSHPHLIKGAGNLKSPAHPTYTACGLTPEGQQLALSLVKTFPAKPEFPDWPDKRTLPAQD